METRVTAVIPARYESTRLPGKPLAEIAGKPMIQHVYERAAQGADRVIVATDDSRIFTAVRAFGGEVVMTKSEHRSGTDRVAEVAETLTDEIIVNVQGDVPFLSAAMLDAVAAPLRRDSSLPMGTIKTSIRDPTDFANPNVVKVVTDLAGNALYFSRSPLPYWRSESKTTFKHIGLYAYRRDFLLHFARLEQTPLEVAESLEQLRALEHGFSIRVTEVDEPSIEVDTPADLEHARLLAGRAS